jgi:ribosomal protein S18 acetylase RimI-like enzyme
MQVHVSAGSDDRTRILDVLTLAFCTDPPVRWMYPEAAQYYRHYREFAELFGGKAFDIGTAHYTAEYSGVALWLPPNTQSDDQALIEMLQRTVREREMQVVFAYFEEMAKYHPAEPHWHLTLIGVDPIRQGQGHGSALLQHGLSVCDRDQEIAYLECTKPSNIDFYQRYGFELLGTIQIGDAPPIFPMIRRPGAD